MSNLFREIPTDLPEEFTESLVAGRDVRIERIVSRGHRSPEGIWYDQPSDEWVALLTGEAELRFENEPAPRRLRPGDWIHIPAHSKHRVESTATEEDTVWLAVHFA